MNETIIDISYPVSAQLPTWPGSEKFTVNWHVKMPQAINNSTSVIADSHLGTHVDAPLHFVNGGKAVHELDLEKLIGLACVLEIRNVKSITKEHLEKASVPRGCKRLLLKTDNQIYWQNNVQEFQKDFCGLDASAAQWIVDKGIFLVGIDYLSVQRFDDGPETHQILLNNEVIIVETLNLENVKAGIYELICLPIKLKGLEGAPVRAVLRKSV